MQLIQINLLPEELKTKRKISIDVKSLPCIIALVFGIVVFTHLYLSMFGLIRGVEFNILNNKWKKLAPQREILDDLRREYEVLSFDAKIIQQLNIRRLNLAEKLNKLSMVLPSGVWFNELAFSKKDMLLKGSVISLQKEEMNLLNKFIDNLKNDEAFFSDFYDLELSSIQMRTVGGYDIFDFILTGKIKSR